MKGKKKIKVNITMEAARQEMDLLSNSIAAFAHIKGKTPCRPKTPNFGSNNQATRFDLCDLTLIAANPESFGLYFVLGVCFGLVLTLCLLVIRISCKPRTRIPSSAPEKKQLKDIHEEEDEESEEDDDEDEVQVPVTLPSTEIPVGNHTSHSDGTLSVNVFTSAEELERAQRLEERERIIREIWRNGQPDILGSGTGTIGRVHYY